jgi:hypothetical protein
MIAAMAALIASPYFGFDVENRCSVNQPNELRTPSLKVTSGLPGLAPNSTKTA